MVSLVTMASLVRMVSLIRMASLVQMASLVGIIMACKLSQNGKSLSTGKVHLGPNVRSFVQDCGCVVNGGGIYNGSNRSKSTSQLI